MFVLLEGLARNHRETGVGPGEIPTERERERGEERIRERKTIRERDRWGRFTAR